MAFELGARKEELEQQIALITSQWEANLQMQLQPLLAELQSVREETERLFPSQRPVQVQGAGAGSSAGQVPSLPSQTLRLQAPALKVVKSVSTQTD